MKKTTLFCGAAVALLMSMASVADSTDHFKGKQFNTVEEALSALTTYNKRLNKITSQDTLSAADLNTIHELTYTLENALEKIDDELELFAEKLEDIHKGSEAADVEKVKGAAESYFEIDNRLFGTVSK